MNEVEIVEGGHYKIQWLSFTHDLYIIKKCTLKWLFFWRTDWLVVSSFADLEFEQTMTLKEFKSKVLYKVNK